jgi:hypothetical protein
MSKKPACEGGRECALLVKQITAETFLRLPCEEKLHRSNASVHFSLDFIFVSPYIWITLRSFQIANFDVRENHSMKNATKKAAKKAPAKKAPAKKKK